MALCFADFSFISFSYVDVLLFSYLIFCLDEVRLGTSALSEAPSPYHYCRIFWILILAKIWLYIRNICWCSWGEVWILVICSFWPFWNYAICWTEGQRRHFSRLLTNFHKMVSAGTMSSWNGFVWTHTRLLIIAYTLRNKYNIYPVNTQTLLYSSYLIMRYNNSSWLNKRKIEK